MASDSSLPPLRVAPVWLHQAPTARGVDSVWVKALARECGLEVAAITGPEPFEGLEAHVHDRIDQGHLPRVRLVHPEAGVVFRVPPQSARRFAVGRFGRVALLPGLSRIARRPVAARQDLALCVGSRLSPGTQTANGRAAGAVGRTSRSVDRSAIVDRYRAYRRSGCSRPFRAGLVWKTLLCDRAGAQLMGHAGGAADRSRSGTRRPARQELRVVPGLPRSLPHRGDRGTVPGGQQSLYLVPDHRTTWRHATRAASEFSQLGIRL